MVRQINWLAGLLLMLTPLWASAASPDIVLKGLDGAARNMLEFSRQVRQNPGLLMGGTPPKDTAPTR